MRSLLARLALIGTVGIALAGCGTTNGSSLPVGGAPNGAGGGPTQISNQAPPGGTVASVLIDGGVLAAGAYTGFNNASVDTQSALDAGADTPTAGSGALPANPPGSHAIALAGSGAPEEILTFGGTLPALTLPPTTPGQVQALNYGAIVLFAKYTPAVAGSAAPKVSVELVGGSGATTYDVRISCATYTPPLVTPAPAFPRYVCDLPAYGAASGAYSTTYKPPLATAPAGTAGTFSGASAGGAIQNPVVSGASGTFTPIAPPKFYVVLTFSAPTTAGPSGNTLGLDYVYAEQGTQ